VTMLAGGIGITPLRALLEELAYAPGDATLLYRARTAEDFALRSELDAMAERRGLRIAYLPGHRDPEGSWAPAGYGPGADALARLVPDIAGHDVFICGPTGWMGLAAAAAAGAGVPARHIHLEYLGS